MERSREFWTTRCPCPGGVDAMRATAGSLRRPTRTFRQRGSCQNSDTAMAIFRASRRFCVWVSVPCSIPMSGALLSCLWICETDGPRFHRLVRAATGQINADQCSVTLVDSSQLSKPLATGCWQLSTNMTCPLWNQLGPLRAVKVTMPPIEPEGFPCDNHDDRG